MDRFVHEQFPNRVAVLSDSNKGGFLLVVCHRSFTGRNAVVAISLRQLPIGRSRDVLSEAPGRDG